MSVAAVQGAAPAAIGSAPRRGLGLLPGLLLVGLVALAAHLLSRALLPYALAIGFEVPGAMLLGLAVSNLLPQAPRALPGVRFSARYILGAGVILLGLRLDLLSITQIGAKALGLVLLTVTGGCVFATLLGRRLGVPARVAMLLGLGSTICGNSAILAAAPVLGADEREVSFAVATITLIGTLAVFVLPLLGHALGLNVLTYGVWTGASVPDTAQTVASSAVYSTVARDVATVVKLVRTAMLAPALLALAWSWGRMGLSTPLGGDAARRGLRRAFPFFLVGFLLLAAVRTERLIGPDELARVDRVTRACFVVALAALGLQTRFTHLRSYGRRGFMLGVGTSSLLAAGSLPLIVAFGIGPARTAVRDPSDPRLVAGWASVCAPGAAPAWIGAFAATARLPGGIAGTPLACARLRPDGRVVQVSAGGWATLDPTSGTAVFRSPGGREWTLPAGAPPPPGALPPGVARVRLTARVIADGIPGAGAISPVGSFHRGGPFSDSRAFAARTAPGAILDPARLLVASSSNFGEPAARTDWRAGSILSLDPRGSALAVPPGFAAGGGQARVAGGRIRIYTAQSPGFLNRVNTPGAVTGAMPAVGGPTGISVNNAFGRPWFANAPQGARRPGAETVTDPSGLPLADAPSESAGGVFAGRLTDRRPQFVAGALDAGAVGNAFLGASPDATGRAAFAVAGADGSIAQVHVEDGVDGLAAPGTFAPLADGPAGGVGPWRVGMVFNWVPDRYLYVTDPLDDAILKLHLGDDFHVFRVLDVRRLSSPALAEPVDLAPAIPEIANPDFASNTTLAGGADMYVANRGSGTIVRLRQNGRIVAVARLVVPGRGAIGPGELAGIAVAPDAEHLWLTLSGDPRAARVSSGTVLEVPAFGGPS